MQSSKNNQPRLPGRASEPHATVVAGFPGTPFNVNKYDPLLYHLRHVNWGVFGSVTWKNPFRRSKSARAHEERMKDFRGVLYQTTKTLGLRDRDPRYYAADEYGNAEKMHMHFLVAKQGLKHVSPGQFAERFSTLWKHGFRPFDAETVGIGTAFVEPYNPDMGNAGVNYCLKREYDDNRVPQERYDFLSPKLLKDLCKNSEELSSVTGLITRTGVSISDHQWN